jgi:cytochrome b subunit of formate dehydrogenase
MKADNPPNNYLTDYILDEIICPVARMRLLSDGINENTRLLAHDHVIGDKACIACGNCVDACPVVEEKHGFIYLPNQRTSMALEHMVGLECRRCYRCIKSCPQVDKPIKEYAANFRRGEKVIHMMVAASIVFLALSGSILSHYRDVLPSLEVFLLDFTHRVFGVVLLVVPYLYVLLDRKHLVRWLKSVFRWRATDRRWFQKLIRHIKTPRDNPMPYAGEFNPAQKAWYIFVTLMIPLMTVTGLILMLGFRSDHTSLYANVKLLHMGVALLTDILLLIHIYLKYLRNWALKIYAIAKSYKERRHLNYYLP